MMKQNYDATGSIVENPLDPEAVRACSVTNDKNDEIEIAFEFMVNGKIHSFIMDAGTSRALAETVLTILAKGTVQ